MSKSFIVSASNAEIGEFKASFKVTSVDRAASMNRPELAGQKRETMKVSFGLRTVGNTSMSEDVVLILNEALVSYAKGLIQDHDGDWDYAPTVDEVTVEKLAESIRKPSTRGQRILTVANIRTWAAWITGELTETLGKSSGFAGTVTTLAEKKFSRLLGMPEKISVVIAALTDDKVIDHLGELDNSDQGNIIADVHGALIERLDELKGMEKVEVNLGDLE